MGGDVKMPGKGNRGKAFSGVAAATTGPLKLASPVSLLALGLRSLVMPLVLEPGSVVISLALE